MKKFWLPLVAAGLLAVAAIAPAAAQDTVTIDMREVDESGQSGSADITSDGEQSIIAIEITPGPDGEPQPAHIHEGSCVDLGDVAFPLDDVVDGVSESTADVSLSELLAGEYAINVHLSEDEMGVHVACGTLPLIGAPAGEADDEEAEEDATEDAEEAEDADEGVEDDDAAVEDEADDDVEATVPATGSTGGIGTETAVLMMTLFSGVVLGAGLLVRRRSTRT